MCPSTCNPPSSPFWCSASVLLYCTCRWSCEDNAATLQEASGSSSSSRAVGATIDTRCLNILGCRCCKEHTPTSTNHGTHSYWSRQDGRPFCCCLLTPINRSACFLYVHTAEFGRGPADQIYHPPARLCMPLRSLRAHGNHIRS